MPGLASLWRRGQSPGADLLSQVTRVATDLEALNRSTEADFLAVGGALTGFLSAATGIQATVQEFAGSLSGEAGDQVCNTLYAVLERSDALQRRVDAAALCSEGFRRDVKQLQREFSGLSSIVLSFQVAATFGRVETARLGSGHTDLGHLSEAVQSCAASIQNQVDQALDAAELLERKIELTMGRISDLGAEELRELPALVRSAEESLEAFRARRRLAHDGLSDLRGRFDAFSERMSVVVTALQGHDITRQQVEHVVDSLKQIGEAAGSCSSDRAAAVDLQRRQLAGASERFALSVRQVQGELDEIAALGREIAAAAKALLGLAENERDSFYSQMEACFARVLSAVVRCEELERETAGAEDELQETIATLQSCVNGIYVVGQEIRYLAINTTIEAVRIGDSGEPLSVIAGAMQGLRCEATDRADQAQRALGAVSAAAAAMSSAESGCQADAVLRGLEAGIVQLHESSVRTSAWSEQIETAAARLCAEVERATAGFQVGSRFTEIADQCGSALQAAASAGGPRTAMAAATLHSAADRYTMQAERDLHETVAAQAGWAPINTSAIPASPAPEGSVELF